MQGSGTYVKLRAFSANSVMAHYEVSSTVVHNRRGLSIGKKWHVDRTICCEM